MTLEHSPIHAMVASGDIAPDRCSSQLQAPENAVNKLLVNFFPPPPPPQTNSKSKKSLVFLNSSLKTGHILESAHLNSVASLNTQLAVIVLIRKKISLKLSPTCFDHKIYIFFLSNLFRYDNVWAHFKQLPLQEHGRSGGIKRNGPAQGF